MEFVHDQRDDERSFRPLNLPDDFRHEVLDIDVDLSLSSLRLIRRWSRIIDWRDE